MKDIERWLAEAKVSANTVAGNLEWGQSTGGPILDSGEVDAKERWALEKLCDGLLEAGILVPLSKR